MPYATDELTQRAGHGERLSRAARRATICALLLLAPTLAHAVTYRFVKPQARGGSASNSGVDTTNALSLCKVNLTATAGTTYVLMPGDYSADPTTSGLSCGCCLYFDWPQLQNDIAPQSRGTGLSPDSSIRFMSYAYYANADTTGIDNYYVDAIALGGSGQINGGARVVVIGVRAGSVAISKDQGITGAQQDSLKWCYLGVVGINGVNTGWIYGCTIAGMVGGDSVCPDELPSSVVEIGGNASGCFPTCSNQSINVSIRNCTIRADSMRANGKIFRISGRTSYVTVDSCRIEGIASPLCGGTAISGLWADAANQYNTFKDNRWTLDMVRGEGGTSGDLSLEKNKLAFYWLYLRDSTTAITFLRDTVNACTRAMSGPGTGIKTHWSASGASAGPITLCNFESCVIRGELAPSGWDAQYTISDNRWYGNSFFVDSGGTPFRFHQGMGGNNRIQRNTIVTREDVTVSLETSSVTPNPALKNRFEENVLVRMGTTCVGNGSGAVAFMQSPITFPNAFIVNKNLYYSYTGAVSQAVSWGGSRGSCVGVRFSPSCADSCVGGGCANTPAACWTQPPNNFDSQSRWGDPLLMDTTAAMFSGNIRCYAIGTGTRSAAYNLLPDSAVGARQPQGATTDPREPYEYVTDSLGRQVVVDTISTSASSITFKFKAPPDNALSLTGTPSEYLIAVSNFPITAANFGQSTTFATPPGVAAPGSTVSFTISATAGLVYFVAVRTVGSCGRLSPAVSVNGCAVARGSLVLCE